MKASTMVALLAGLVSAAPADVDRRQIGLSTSNELTSGACRDVIFIFARGTTEQGNMGSAVGPQTCSALKSRIGSTSVACQGVGSPYAADVTGNFGTRGASTVGIAEGKRLFELAASKCPNSQIVAGGYSQGAALIAASVTDVSAAVKAKIAGVVLFGYTKNQQNRGVIPGGYPASQTKVYCNIGDLVCTGSLTITAAHLTYGRDASSAAQFLQGTL
ncbi:Chain A like protein [Zymoseptoria brevis]|uniref:Cutinase n=1 Tax=Zymoseptoria brevis TaxID=1047168 RepID=A0A0F4G9N1_9PEZI|nr:Chain A like protein [Zymoseptoria brevis]